MATLAVFKLHWIGGATINFLASEKDFGFHVSAWRPVSLPYKGGGVFQNSPIAEGNRLALRFYDNPVDTWTMTLDAVSSDEIYLHLQELRRAFEEAADYWQNDYSSDIPPYLEMRAHDETNTRYAAVVIGGVPNEGSPFSQPFLSQAKRVMIDLTMVINHMIWADNIPGSSTGLLIANSETFNNVLGHPTPTAAAEVFVGNKSNVANLTHIFQDDGGVFGANLLGSTLPYQLLPNPMAVDDAIYFIINTAVADSGPFSSLIFDIEEASSADITTVWEYWSGAAWSTISSFQDNTGANFAFEDAGVNGVHWQPPAGWATTAVNGITGFAVRLRVSALVSSSKTGSQQNRDIYSIVWSYIDIIAANIGGDIPARLRIKMTNEVYDTVAGKVQVSKVIIGLRTLGRGADFVPHLNAADEQNEIGVTVTLGANTAFVTDINDSPSGRLATYTPAAAEAMAVRVRYSLGSNIGNYYGKFRVFVRSLQSGGAFGDFTMQVLLTDPGTGLTLHTSKIVAVPLNTGTSLAQPDLADLGLMTISNPANSSAGVSTRRIEIHVANTNASPGTLSMVDLILMPADEWIGEFVSPVPDPLTIAAAGTLDGDNYLLADSVGYPKRDLVATLHLVSNDEVEASYRTVSPQYIFFQHNKQQRMYFLFDGPGARSEHRFVSRVTFEGVQRYQTGRGAR